jgi:hypothetical protein
MKTPMAKKQQVVTCPKAHEERHPEKGPSQLYYL